MDELGRVTLKAELDADVSVIKDAARVARERFGQCSPVELEACAFQLVRFYNSVEQTGLRVAKAFENHIDDERNWHVQLVRRLSLEIPQVRPRFFPGELIEDLQELRGFRHVVVHAYDLVLRKDRVENVLLAAEKIAGAFPSLVAEFLSGLP